MTLVQVDLNVHPRKPSEILENSFGSWRPRRRESVIRGAAREVALRQKEADRGWQPICDWGPAQRVLEGRPESIKGMP